MHARIAFESLGELLARFRSHHAASYFRKDDNGIYAWHCFTEVAERAHQALQTDRVCGTDRDDGVGSQQRGQGRAIASWCGRVERQLLVLLE